MGSVLQLPVVDVLSFNNASVILKACAASQGLQDVIGLSVTHPTWQRTRPDDPKDEHTGWTFASPDDPPLASPTGAPCLARRPRADPVQLVEPLVALAQRVGEDFTIQHFQVPNLAVGRVRLLSATAVHTGHRERREDHPRTVRQGRRHVWYASASHCDAVLVHKVRLPKPLSGPNKQVRMMCL